MLKFRCTHCGHRLAVVERHLSRLARCPECDCITHPLAEQILAKQKSEQKKKRRGCDNCGHRLGKLQKPRRWGEATVCAPCYRELALETAERDQAENERSNLPRPRASVTVLRGFSSRPAVMLSAPRITSLLTAPGSARQDAVDSTEIDLRATLKNIGAAVLVTAAAIIVSLYILRTVGYLIVWSIVAGLFLCAAYGVIRLVRFARRPTATAESQLTKSAAIRTLSGQILTGGYRLCSAAGASMWRAARRSPALEARLQQHT